MLKQNSVWPVVLTWLVFIFGALTSAGGLLIEGLYRDSSWAVPQSRGQDLVTFFALFVMLFAMFRARGSTKARARGGSVRAVLVWIGLLGYMLYSAIGAAFAYALNSFFLVYIGFFSSAVFAIVAVVGDLDLAHVDRELVREKPHRGAVCFLLALSLMLTALWLGQLVPFLISGLEPEGIVKTGGAIRYVYVLDLGLVVPTALLGAVWLMRRVAWGAVLTGVVLVKGAAMGLSLLSMTWFMLRAGQPVEVGLTGVWVLLAGSALAVSLSFFRAK